MVLLSFLLILSCFQGAPAQATETTAKYLIELEARFAAALLNKDAAECEKLLADDLLHIGFDGRTGGKTEYMIFFRQGGWRYQKYEPANVAVKVLGNVAVVTGRVDRKIVIDGQETTGALAFTHVWSRAGGSWRITSSQFTNIPSSKS